MITVLAVILAQSWLIPVNAAEDVEKLRFTLEGTTWERVGKHYNLNPYLLYAVAITESATGGIRTIRPHPWAIRTPQGPQYPATIENAEELLRSLAPEARNGSDIGIMQVNYGSHRSRVGKASDLLDPERNLDIGAQILVEALQSAPNDDELGVGRYNSWRDEGRARAYGKRVLFVYKELWNLTSKAARKP